LTKIAKEKRISIVSFRPQKVIEGASLRQLPFSLNVDGSFLNVADMIASIEKPGTKLAVSQIQFASKDGGETGDQISASITLVAYLDKPASKETAKSTSTPLRKPTTTTTKG
ncbi:MAG: type 4a pilus biogenesis protein PilO, partial [Armatimonadota bacterium]